MEVLKDLPSYNKENFSRFTQGSSKVEIFERERVAGSLQGGERERVYVE
jgi:hypothetical protein